jgi:hypothetical protein
MKRCLMSIVVLSVLMQTGCNTETASQQNTLAPPSNGQKGKPTANAPPPPAPAPVIR